jgi:single-strand DNA-binding protein
MNIIGRLTKDAEVRTTLQEKQVVNFSIAINDSYRNKQGERIEQTSYFDCSYWISPNVAKILLKGALVELTGRVSTRA